MTNSDHRYPIPLIQLSPKELERYDRHIRLTDFGIDGQYKLKQARVLCIGAGGLGCATLPYLAAAGVGKLTIVDSDRIELSNLQRQIFYTTRDIGKYKAEILAARLKQLNDQIDITACNQKLTAESARQWFPDYDLIIDASDNFNTRYTINDFCNYAGKPFVSAAIDRFNGQCFLLQPDQVNQPCYRCLFPQASLETTNCNQAGVLGVLPGIIGTFQAHLTICALLGRHKQYSNRLFYYQGTDLSWRCINITADPICINRHHGKLPVHTEVNTSLYITSDNSAALIAQNAGFQLIDVRESGEYQQNHFNQAVSLPLSDIKQSSKDKLQLQNLIKQHKSLTYPNQLTILYCQRGPRSIKAYQILKQQGYKQLKILQGGITESMQNPKLVDTIWTLV